jgi:hypothetical protein
VGYVSGLVSLGLAPRSVLQIDENGDGRLPRLYRLIKQCGASVHDLSYPNKDLRYNMPFELGIAFSMTREYRGKIIYVFEGKRFDVRKTLTDIAQFDPRCHQMKGALALEGIYDCFTSPSRSNPEIIGRKIYHEVMAKLRDFRQGTPSLFSKRCFSLLVKVTSDRATALASK